MSTVKRSAKNNFNRSRRILPAVFLACSVLLMMLPLEGAVSSIKSVLSYIFIPQIKAAHDTVQYSDSVWENVKDLLHAHQENIQLKEQLERMQLENAQAKEIFQENQRLREDLQLKAPARWQGIWAKTAYREPSQWNSVIIDKGTAEGIETRAAVVAYKKGQPVLAGVVLETNEHTAKILLLRDEDFSAAVYVDATGDEGLLSGAGPSDLKMSYLPLLSRVKTGDLIYTSSVSGIFPAGILVGKVTNIERKEGNISSSLTVHVEPEADGLSIRELFVLMREKGK